MQKEFEPLIKQIADAILFVQNSKLKPKSVLFEFKVTQGDFAAVGKQEILITEAK